MRADRLLSILMLLQSKGKMTAADLSTELEVTVRTIYRDVIALCTSGAPIYCERGPGGGISLIDSYKTDLTGLTKDEVRALFMLSIPSALTDLGMGQKLKAAYMKLSASLPATLRQDQEQVRQRIHIDLRDWAKPDASIPSLQTVQTAVWEERVLQISYQLKLGPQNKLVESEINPYGIVSKSGVWFLIYALDEKTYVIRVDRLFSTKIIDRFFHRPGEFDLIEFWSDWCRHIELTQPRYIVQLRISPLLSQNMPDSLESHLKYGLSNSHPSDNSDWIDLSMEFNSLESARERILGFGSAAEVIAPQALRASLIDYAKQVLSLYGQDEEQYLRGGKFLGVKY